jgi:hypothetical protein
MNNRITICILLCLAMLACGQAAAQGTFGTKVNAGDPDVGLPLSLFAPPQAAAAVFYWDVGSTPALYDDKDVAYLKFGLGVPAQVQANSIRLTGWSTYPAGSYVKPGDTDIGQSLVIPPPALPSAFQTSFYYMNAVGGAGYDLGDPVYLKVGALPIPPSPTIFTGTNDIRITPNAGFPAGSRVSLNDPDAAKPLTPFMFVTPIGVFPTAPRTPIAQLAFFNANGNTNLIGAPIYDEGDVVYFDVNPGVPAGNPVVSPNDVRLY